VRALLKRGYRAARFTDALTQDSGGRVFAVTFDDAYASVVSLAFPVLSQLGVPATVFVPTRADRNGVRDWEGIREWSDTPWGNELSGASWSQLKELVAGGWEIGSHTRTHPDLTNATDEELHAELAGSRKDCEAELGAPCTSIAYPYGRFDQRVEQSSRRAGYQVGAGLAVEGAYGRSRQVMCWPRLALYGKDEPARFWTKFQLFTRAPRLFQRLGKVDGIRA
jgi:peptidoglycan/xylan/chitin deacetylase (PgdA/CDA1 family)